MWVDYSLQNKILITKSFSIWKVHVEIKTIYSMLQFQNCESFGGNCYPVAILEILGYPFSEKSQKEGLVLDGMCCGQQWVLHMFWERACDGLCGLLAFSETP